MAPNVESVQWRGHAVLEDLLHLRDVHAGRLHLLAGVRMPEAIVCAAPVEGVSKVVRATHGWRSPALSWRSAGPLRTCSKTLRSRLRRMPRVQNRVSDHGGNLCHAWVIEWPVGGGGGASRGADGYGWHSGWRRRTRGAVSGGVGSWRTATVLQPRWHSMVCHGIK
jgi:hypothetical protein